MKGHCAQLPRKQEAAIAALLSHPSIDLAAKSIGVTSRTLRRWMQLPEFNEEFLKARREGVAQANARIQQNAGAAAAVLLRMMADPTNKASHRLQASKYVLEIAAKSLETDDLAMRIARLESQAERR
jgi:hypothetical protein